MAAKKGNAVAGRGKLVFDLPDNDTAGYLMRQKELLRAQKELSDTNDPDKIDQIAELIAEYVVEPQDKAKARMMILTLLSRNEYISILKSLAGTQQDEDEVNPQNADNSDDG